MITINNLCAGYGKKAILQDICLTLRTGEITGILGPNGSGKTTLLSAAAGIIGHSRGTVCETMAQGQAQDLLTLPARKRAQRIAFVPQRGESNFPLTGLALVLMGRYAHQKLLGTYSSKDKEIALQAMETTGVAHLHSRYITTMSGGEFQRVLFARALAQDTHTLFLDEPTASLDPSGTVALFDLLRQKTRAGATVLVAVHDLNLAALYCQQLVFLEQGRIVAQGYTQDVFTQSTLERLYKTALCISQHPVTGAPQAHLVPAACTTACA